MNSFLENIGNPSSDLTCAVQTISERKFYSIFNFGELSSIFLFLSSHVGVDGFISNISLGSSYGWYFRVDQFELIFLGLLMLQLCILRYIEILPINMNNLFLGDPSGRRRRRDLISSQKVCRRDELSESMLQVLKKLDDGECFPLVLCQLQVLSKPGISFSEMDYELPEETQRLLLALNMSGKYRQKYSEIEACKTSPNMEYFEKAVKIGESGEHSNSTICQDHYHACPLTTQDVIHYVGILVKADML